MEPVNDTAIYARQILTPSDAWEDGLVYVRNGRIDYAGNQSIDLPPQTRIYSGPCLIPGMIDLQVNGSGGGDAADCTPESLEKIARMLAAHGTTSFLPTVITAPDQDLAGWLRGLAALLEQPAEGARPLGIHLEGPFINPEKRGAHPADGIQRPSVDLFRRYLDAADGKLLALTLAPELDGSEAVIEAAREYLPVIALGHSCADYGTTQRAIEAGVNLATHLFNAMTPLHHREPGVVGAVLDSDRISAALILDGIHIHPAIARLVARCKGTGQMILVTDAVAAAGMPDGTYRVGNVTVQVAGGICRDFEGRLAGSTLTMDGALQNSVEWLQDLVDDNLKMIVSMATVQPANLLGLSGKGRIEKGFDADLVLVDEDFQVLKTWVRGKLVYDAETRREGTLL